MRDTELHGETLDYWKANAEENYMKVPISVLKYITVLEEVQNQRVIEELEYLDDNYPSSQLQGALRRKVRELKQN